MTIDFNNHIGGYYKDVRTGKWSIIGASDRMNEAFNNKMNCPKFEWDDISKTAVPFQVKSEVINSENYADFRKPTGTMPKHCYGTAYGYKQAEEINEELKSYYVNHTGSVEELKEYFKECCKDMRVILAQERKTTGIDVNDNAQIIMDVYEQFRMANSVMANMGCEKEGEKIAQENGWQTGTDCDWVYYNAEFYYSSEELREAFKEAANEMASEWDIDEIDLSERDSDRYLSYSSSFNEIWKNGGENGTRICSFLDASEKPPKDFYLFFRESSDRVGNNGLLNVGIKGEVNISKNLIFNLYNGTQQQYPQFYHLKELLENELKEYKNSDFAKFLSNFDIYTRYYGTTLLHE